MGTTALDRSDLDWDVELRDSTDIAGGFKGDGLVFDNDPIIALGVFAPLAKEANGVLTEVGGIDRG